MCMYVYILISYLFLYAYIENILRLIIFRLFSLVFFFFFNEISRKQPSSLNS